jgi:predicted O-linked N-acetylglucosamine transferase (SPINDLY family)
MAYHRAGKLAEANALYEQILQISPTDSDALHLRGLVADQQGQHEIAVGLIEQALRLDPRNPYAHNNRGNALRDLKQFEAALDSYDKAILFKPDLAEAHNNRGNALRDLKQFEAALGSYDKAILLQPDLAQAYNNRGNVLEELKQYGAALENYEKAIVLQPDSADAHNNRGIVLQDLKQYPAALESYDKAILLKPANADSYSNRGQALQDLKQYAAALESYDKAILLKPDYEYLRGRRLLTKRLLCDWEDHESHCKQLETQIEHGEKAAKPFDILAVLDSPSLQRKAAEIYVQDRYPFRSTSPIPRRSRRDKIRVGYFSADYRNHAISYLITGLFERHDKSRFELLAFSFGPEANDEMSQRVVAAMDRFVDVRSLSDRDVAQLSRELEVDIAVDLSGFTHDSRPQIFAERAAPIQVNYLGYPGTMGAPYIDYLIGDHTVIPEASRRHYSEKIVYLPDSYQVNDSRRSISAKPCTRADEGLPKTGFVYCCFNNNYKITPGMFDIWMRILGRVEHSVLWLYEDNPGASSNLRKEAAARGVAPDRLIFANFRPLVEHLARLRLADLFLDTVPYNAHTTASDALWAGLPVLTCMGECFASRVAASLLRAIHLPELIAPTHDAYESLAAELALDPHRARAIKGHLQRNRLTTPLFDTRAFTRHIELAYSAMYARYRENMSPEDINIQRLDPGSSAAALGN